MVWPTNRKEKKEKRPNRQKQKRALPRPNVRKYNVLVIWMIINNDFYEHSENKRI